MLVPATMDCQTLLHDAHACKPEGHPPPCPFLGENVPWGWDRAGTATSLRLGEAPSPLRKPRGRTSATNRVSIGLRS